jgi:hypothetical protein
VLLPVCCSESAALFAYYHSSLLNVTALILYALLWQNSHGFGYQVGSTFLAGIVFALLVEVVVLGMRTKAAARVAHEGHTGAAGHGGVTPAGAAGETTSPVVGAGAHVGMIASAAESRAAPSACAVQVVTLDTEVEAGDGADAVLPPSPPTGEPQSLTYGGLGESPRARDSDHIVTKGSKQENQPLLRSAHPLVWVILVGDAFHNVVDGIALAAGFVVRRVAAQHMLRFSCRCPRRSCVFVHAGVQQERWFLCVDRGHLS